MDAGRGRFAQLRAEPERVENGRAQVLLEGHLGRARDRVGQLLETRVRVDAPAAGLRDRLIAVEGQSRRVGEEMANGRAFGPGSRVQVDRPFLRGDERRQRDDGLRHGCPAEDDVARTMRRDDVAVAEDTDRRFVRAPALDLPQGLHAARY